MLFKPIVERRFGMFSHLESSKSGPAPRESFPPQPGADQGKSWKTLVPGPFLSQLRRKDGIQSNKFVIFFLPLLKRCDPTFRHFFLAPFLCRLRGPLLPSKSCCFWYWNRWSWMSQRGGHTPAVCTKNRASNRARFHILFYMPQGRDTTWKWRTQQTMSLQEALASQKGQREGAAAVDSLELDDWKAADLNPSWIRLEATAEWSPPDSLLMHHAERHVMMALSPFSIIQMAAVGLVDKAILPCSACRRGNAENPWP